MPLLPNLSLKETLMLAVLPPRLSSATAFSGPLRWHSGFIQTSRSPLSTTRVPWMPAGSWSSAMTSMRRG
jgi:hypothetical protein